MSNTKTNKYFIYNFELSTIPSDLKFMEPSKIKKIKNATEIFILDLLDFIDINEQTQICQDINSALHKDGFLFVQGVDVHGVSAAVLNNQIDVQTYNNLVFSPSKVRLSSIGSILTLLKETGFIILEAKFINGVQYSIKCGKKNG